jgi:hypothetical protein
MQVVGGLEKKFQIHQQFVVGDGNHKFQRLIIPGHYHLWLSSNN